MEIVEATALYLHQQVSCDIVDKDLSTALI